MYPPHQTPRLWRAQARAGAVLFAAAALAACAADPPEITPSPTLAQVAPADEAGSCMSCHPRQFNEWLGSSHNYGSGLDGTYQALEVTANYYANHVLGAPVFRQNMLCITCHAPTAGNFINDPSMGQVGMLDPNVSLREGDEAQGFVGREIPRPSAGTDLLPPAGRAIEMQQAEGLTPEELAQRRRITFQGITCDACHKVSGPVDDRAVLGECPEGMDPKECAQRDFEACLDSDDPICKRRSLGQHAHGEPFIDLGISNFGFILEREGDVRFGPFTDTEAVAATAHGVSSGGTELARNYNVAAYPDKTPFPNQDPDVRPYLKTSQFCGACHDVRLNIDNPATPEVELEPVHGEPFMRLENLYTEWFISPLNLHPDTQGASADARLMWRDNPYRNADGSARRVVCQDCHMALYPYAPPGVFPGDYTHSQRCDEQGDCGLQAAIGGARGNLRIQNRDRMTTHNMTGVDIALGNLQPIDPEVENTLGTMLPNQTVRPDLSGSAVFSGVEEILDDVYDLPVSVDTRRQALLKNVVTVSLGGTPEVIDRASPEGCEETGTCCDEDGVCSLPVKAWITNVNGGHNVAAGFSQERQVWVELTVQDMGRKDETGQGMLVDCALVPRISELYTEEGTNAKGFPTREPKPHTVDSATDLFNRLSGADPATGEIQHELICRGISGHLIDKPHDETHEPVADGRLDDEDILLHRIGNTLPEFEDGSEAISWHVMDLGFNEAGDSTSDVFVGKPGPDVSSARVARADQFHIPGLDPFACQLTGTHLNHNLDDQPIVMRDGSIKKVSEVGNLKYAVTQTPDERLEILYPFPEMKALRPHYDDEGHWHLGERFGLAYITNIFYRVCGCENGECEGPEELTVDGETYHAQVPWLTTFPTLPHQATIDYDHPDHDDYHFPVDTHEYDGILKALNMEGGTPYAEAFTFVPLNANHMPNNRSLKFYQPQRHYWDIRVGPEVVGPIRVTAKVWYRHFPPEFLRLMIRSTEQLYERSLAEGLADDYYPHGPLVVEGENNARFPQAASMDNLRRVLLDESVTYVHIGERPAVKSDPTYAQDVAPILANHCLPCHSDVLRHGNLILDYDDYPQWDYPLAIGDPNPEQDPRLNLVDAKSGFANGRILVNPGDVEGSLLWELLTSDDDELLAKGIYSRHMPLKTDKLNATELETIRNWIASGAR